MSRHPASMLNRYGAACCAVLAFAMFLAPPAAHAQSSADNAAMAALDDEDPAPRMTLQASASAEVMQDTVRISLTTEVEAADQPTAGRQLTAALDDIVKRARGTEGVDVRTGSFNVWPNNNSKGKITSWRGQGEIVLQSKDFAKASELASKLSDKTAISNIGFSLSREARDAQERKLLNQVAQAFRERAVAATNAFGFTGYRVMRLELGGSGGAVPVQRMTAAPMMMAKEGRASADVPLEAGEVTVTVSVSGTIALQ